MSATKKPTGVKAKPPKREGPDDLPQFFRLNVEVASQGQQLWFCCNTTVRRV